MLEPLQPQTKKLTAKQIRILGNLHYIGEGPRIFFQDAIALINDSSLESKQHLIGHLMREIDSAIRSIVKPLLNSNSETKKSSKCDGHEASIKDTLLFLGIDHQSDVGMLWLKYGNTKSEIQFHKFAHRKDLTYRTFNDEFYREWQNFEIILDEVLDRFTRKYLYFIKEAERFSSLVVVSASDESTFRNTIAPGSPLFRVFIGKLTSIAWFDSLMRMNYFQFSENEKYLIQETHYYYWSPLVYLNKLIELNEFEKVSSVIQALPQFDNFGLHQEITKLYLQMPESYFLNWMEKEYEWFQRSRQLNTIHIDLYLEAIEKAWNLQNEKLCFELMSSLLTILPDPDWDYKNGKSNKSNVDNLWQSPKPSKKLPGVSYLKVLTHFVGIVKEKLPLKLIQFLSNLLENMLMYGLHSWEKTEDNYLDDHSYITRPSIWDHPQNYNHKLSDKLVPLFRDAILNYIKDQESFDVIIELVKQKRCLLFQRFYVFVIGKEGRNRNPNLFDEVLYNQIYAEDDCFGNEYYSLLSQNYAYLSKEEQVKYIDWLDTWANELEEKYKLEYQSKEVQENRVLNDIYNPKHRIDLFFYRKLPGLQGYLPQDKENYLAELKEKYSKSLVKPEFPHYHESFVGPISPLENLDISVLSVRELIQKMIEFQKEEDGWNEPSPEGLARQISRDVEINSSKYLNSIGYFFNVQIPERYLGALLWGFRGAIDNRMKLESEALCKYLQFLSDLIKSKPIDQTLHLQHALASFFRTIFEKKIIPKEAFDRFDFLDWISVLLRSSSPDESYEEKGEDFVSKGINSVRGNALHSLAYFSIDYFRKFLNDDASKASDDPRVKRIYSILRDHFMSEYSERKTDRSVFGQHFAFLYWLNPNWFRENRKLILNENKELSRLFFFSYIQYGSYSPAIYLEFKEWFSDSIDYLSDLGENAQEEKGIRPLRVGNFLVNLYGNGIIESYDDPLLEKFFSLPQGFLKANAIRFLGENAPANEPSVLKKAEVLWRWRLDNDPSFEEFEVFSLWIDRGVYSEELIFETLSKVRLDSRISFGIESYLRFVKDNFSKGPKISIEFINLVTEENSYLWNAKPGDDVWEILVLGITSSEASVREMAKDIIHRLGSYEYFQYRELLGI